MVAVVDPAFRLFARKLGREVWRSRAEVVSIALVMAAAVAAAVMAADVRRSLESTLEAYYTEYRFADVFASAQWAPGRLAPQILALPGVAVAETRMVTFAALLPEGADQPAIGRVISLPDGRDPQVNRIAVVAGHSLSPERPGEILVTAPFAEAHGIGPGDGLTARIGGQTLELTVSGIALAPEAVFALGPGQLVPDDHRFAVVWMGRSALAGLLGHVDEFNEVLVRLRSPSDEPAVRRALDDLLEPYGGMPAYGRRRHPSHAFVQGQIDQLAGLALLLPPIFLLVSAFLIHGAILRVVETERTQIGLLGALGISRRIIRSHYLLYALVIAALGCVGGLGLGWWLGRELTGLYANFFRFPAIARESDGLAAFLACGVVLLFAAGSALLAVQRTLALAPAAAMRRPPPVPYRAGRARFALDERIHMLWRQLLRQRGRAALTFGATALAIALILATLFSFDALDRIVEVTGRSERQDAMLLSSEPVPAGILKILRGLPGISRAEGFRTTSAQFLAGERRQTAPLTGLPAGGRLRRLLGTDLAPMPLPTDGIALSATLADLLEVRAGDRVQIRLPGDTAPRNVVVAGLTEQYFGVEASVTLDTLDTWLGDGPLISGARVTFEPGGAEKFHASQAELPQLVGYVDKAAALSTFRATMARTLTILVSFFVIFAVLTTIGVVFSNARVLLAERRRDLAILRALGFGGRETTALLLAELMAPAVVAAPAGLVLGRLFGWIIVRGLDTALFRIPLVVAPSTDLAAAAIVLFAALAAALLVGRTAARFDLVPALSERD